MDTVEYKGYTIKIEADSDPLNPRGDDFDCLLGTMVCMHRRYDLGDDRHLSDGSKLKSSDFNGWDAMIAHVDKVEGGIIWLPIYMYDHSGYTIRTTPFDCRWDSGQLGFIYVSKKKARETFGWKVLNKKRIAQVEEALRSEVQVYDDYLTGSVYSYTVVKPDGTDGDSCGGFYGSDHEKSGLLENARNSIDCEIKYALKTEGVQQELQLTT